jgi:Flp pilus assembly protein TadD
MNKIDESRALVEEIWARPEAWETNLRSAEALLASALAAHPDDIRALTCMGAVLSDQARHEEAVPMLRHAASLGSTDRNTYFNLGVALLGCATKAEAEAMTAFDTARKFDAADGSWEAYFDPQAQ